MTHPDPLSLHLDPLQAQFLLLLLLSGQRIGHAHEPRGWVRGWVVLWTQVTRHDLLLVLVIHHYRGKNTQINDQGLGFLIIEGSEHFVLWSIDSEFLLITLLLIITILKLCP